MQVISDGILRKLIPDKGYKLAHKDQGFVVSEIYLCLADSPDNYVEVIDEDYIPMNYVVDLAELKETTNDTLDVIMAAMDELYVMFEPILAMIPMTMSMDEITEPIVNPMVKFYVLMVQRGLKTKDEVPEKFKSDVINLMNK